MGAWGKSVLVGGAAWWVGGVVWVGGWSSLGGWVEQPGWVGGAAGYMLVHGELETNRTLFEGTVSDDVMYCRTMYLEGIAEVYYTQTYF